MRLAVITLALAAVTQSASASALDDYASCLIGSAAVALNQQTGGVDAEKAKASAYDHCKDLKTTDETGRLDDFVTKAVDALAKIVPPQAQ